MLSGAFTQMRKYNDGRMAFFRCRILPVILIVLWLAGGTALAEAETRKFYIERTLRHVLYLAGEEQIVNLRRDVSCFSGQFEKEGAAVVRDVVRRDNFIAYVYQLLKANFTEDELYHIAVFYNQPEGKQALTNFANSIQPIQKKALADDHEFFKQPLGQKIISLLPALKTQLTVQGLLIITQNLWGVGDVYLRYMNLDGSCRI